MNRWLPAEPLLHCLTHTGSRLILLDSERADRIAFALPRLRSAGVDGFLVFDAPGRASKWEGIEVWETAVQSCVHGSQDFLGHGPQIEPEDNATIIFTSGTCVPLLRGLLHPLTSIYISTGLPKGVLSTQRQFLTNLRNVCGSTCSWKSSLPIAGRALWQLVVRLSGRVVISLLRRKVLKGPC